MRHGFITFVVGKEEDGQVIMTCDRCGRCYWVKTLMDGYDRLVPWVVTRVLAHAGAHDMEDIRVYLDISYML